MATNNQNLRKVIREEDDKLYYPRKVSPQLSFRGESLLRGRHLIHPYPAMFHPLLVDYLIDEFAKNGDTILDPFCGSGVVCLQASEKGYKSAGFDINPMALLISDVKLQKYNKNLLLKELSALEEDVRNNDKVDVPNIKNIAYWYKDDVINDLGRIRYVLKNKRYRYLKFFLAVFAFVCRNQSLTRNGEFKRFRIRSEKIDDVKNEVFPKFFEHSKKMVNMIIELPSPKQKCNLKFVDVAEHIPLNYDLVITSPPYGDSRTTVAYGQYSSFGIEWSSDINPYSDITGNDVDKVGLGKKIPIDIRLLKHEALQDTLRRIENIDNKRANEVLHFFNGYHRAICNVVENLNGGGRVCFLVGNRTVKGIQIPMDQITASFFESLGMKFKEILVREISNKVMPLRNSPSNVTGDTANTMTKEYIVLLEK